MCYLPSLPSAGSLIILLRTSIRGGFFVFSGPLFPGLFHRLQRAGELVRAGGRLVAASDALQPLDRLVHVHAGDEGRDALRVAAAAAVVLYVCDDAPVVDLDVDGRGTGTGGLPGYLFHELSFRVR